VGSKEIFYALSTPLKYVFLSSLQTTFFIYKLDGPKEEGMVKEDLYCVIDLKSFYASCECVARGLDIFKTPLVVCDPDRSMSTIVMSSTPYLKDKYHIPNVCRRRDLPNVENLILAQPRMAYYIEMSAKVVSIFLDYVSEEDLHVYSIDESFLHISPYLSLAKQTPEEFVAEIQKRIKKELGLTATAGIGPNMFLAKVCLDNEGKKKAPYIGRWRMEDVPTKLWSITPITKIWGISNGTERHLMRIGIRSLRELAQADLSLLLDEFGVIGQQLHDLANGIDRTNIREKYIPKETNLSIGQTLPKDYDKKGACLVLREMTDDLCLRLRMSGKKASRVSLFVAYSARVGGGFVHQATLNMPSDDNDTLFEALMDIYFEHVESLPIRNLSISFSKLGEYSMEQLDIFHAPEEKEEKHNLWQTIDKIQARYGKNAVLRLSALTEDSTIIERHGQIGGHKA
jgi:DNA polymerase V